MKFPKLGCLELSLILLVILLYVLLTGSKLREGLSNNDTITALKSLQKQNKKNIIKELSQYTTEVEISTAMDKLTKQFGYQDTINKSISILGGSSIGGEMSSFFGSSDGKDNGKDNGNGNGNGKGNGKDNGNGDSSDWF